jgi:hypothetical protein
MSGLLVGCAPANLKSRASGVEHSGVSENACTPQASPRRLDRTTKFLVIAFLLAVVASLAALGTWSGFSSTTASSGNQFVTGTMSLSDNDSGTAMFDMTGANGGDTVTKCITVQYDGSLTSNVRLYGSKVSGNGLDEYLDLEITRGSWKPLSGEVSGVLGGVDPPAGMACSNGLVSFEPDAETYGGGNGAGAGGVMFSARMNNYPTSWDAGIVDPPGVAPEAWTGGERHVYRIKVTVANDNNALNKTHTQTFTWEARGV